MRIHFKFIKHFVSGFLSAFKFSTPARLPAKASEEAMSELWYKIGKYVNIAEKRLFRSSQTANDNEKND